MLLVLVAVVPLALGVILACGSRRLSRALPPAPATWLLSTASLVTALSTGAVLALFAAVLTGRMGEVAEAGHWSGTAVDGGDPVPDVVGPALAAVVLVLFVAGAHRAVVHARDLASAHLTCRQLGPGVDGLVVVDAPDPDAYALAGFPGRIVVSTAMLRALDPVERRILLAHERSHLRHRHHLHVQIADIAAAANPLLRPAGRAVRFAVERWADEDAARENRPVAARSLARAGLAVAAARRGAPGGALAATAVDVPERVAALLAAPPRPRRGAATLAAALVLGAGGSAVLAAHLTENRFEHAQLVYKGQH
jgi:hypothetical protein